jgi:hypothetical protein
VNAVVGAGIGALAEVEVPAHFGTLVPGAGLLLWAGVRGVLGALLCAANEMDGHKVGVNECPIFPNLECHLALV